jgi:hypothetical protein
MAVTSDSFLAFFPEFQPAGIRQIDEAIAEAVRNTDAAVWGDKTDDGVKWLAAHLLALSPFGQQARLSSKEGKSTYGKRRRQLVLSTTPGFRVA